MGDGVSERGLAGLAVESKPFANNFPGGHARIQGRVGVLEDHLHARGKASMILGAIALG
jgi:hypothetical protein